MTVWRFLNGSFVWHLYEQPREEKRRLKTRANTHAHTLIQTESIQNNYTSEEAATRVPAVTRYHTGERVAGAYS